MSVGATGILPVHFSQLSQDPGFNLCRRSGSENSPPFAQPDRLIRSPSDHSRIRRTAEPPASDAYQSAAQRVELSALQQSRATLNLWSAKPTLLLTAESLVAHPG